jgi:uncharacterized repeat protein (TIGR03847 family)
VTDHDFEQVGRFAPGAMGEPGHRVFYLQAFADGAEVAVKCEKQQTAALAEHLVKLLADLPESEEEATEPPAEALPPEELGWVVGSISIGVDRAESRLVVLLEEFVDPEDPDAVPGRLRVRLTPVQVRAFAAQVEVLLSSSRPLCRLCEQPIDPDGHACPRLN